MSKNYQIQLTDEQRRELKRLVESRQELARKITRARILLLAETGKKDREIAEALQISDGTVRNVRKRFFNQKSISSLDEKPRLGKPSKIDDKTEARITSLACSNPPEGHKRWTLRLLADRAVELKFVDTISHERIRKMLRTN